MTSLNSGFKLTSMKKLSTYLFLILFSFSAPSFADDIRDFQIEGVSIGDSLLDYFSETEIENQTQYIYEDMGTKEIAVIFYLNSYSCFSSSLNIH